MTSNRTGYRVIALASGAALIAIGALTAGCANNEHQAPSTTTTTTTTTTTPRPPARHLHHRRRRTSARTEATCSRPKSSRHRHRLSHPGFTVTATGSDTDRILIMTSNRLRPRLIALAGGTVLVAMVAVTAACGTGGNQAPSTTTTTNVAIEHSPALSHREERQPHRGQPVHTRSQSAPTPNSSTGRAPGHQRRSLNCAAAAS